MRIKVLNLDGVVDGDGDVFDKDSELLFDNDKVWVGYRYPAKELGDFIAFAKLEREGDALYATFEPHGKLVKGLFPSIAGKLLVKDAGHMSKVEIDCIQLTPTKNSDPRIEPIGVEA